MHKNAFGAQLPQGHCRASDVPAVEATSVHDDHRTGKQYCRYYQSNRNGFRCLHPRVMCKPQLVQQAAMARVVATWALPTVVMAPLATPVRTDQSQDSFAAIRMDGFSLPSP